MLKCLNALVVDAPLVAYWITRAVAKSGQTCCDFAPSANWVIASLSWHAQKKGSFVFMYSEHDLEKLQTWLKKRPPLSVMTVPFYLRLTDTEDGISLCCQVNMKAVLWGSILLLLFSLHPSFIYLLTHLNENSIFNHRALQNIRFQKAWKEKKTQQRKQKKNEAMSQKKRKPGLWALEGCRLFRTQCTVQYCSTRVVFRVQSTQCSTTVLELCLEQYKDCWRCCLLPSGTGGSFPEKLADTT